MVEIKTVEIFFDRPLEERVLSREIRETPDEMDIKKEIARYVLEKGESNGVN